MDKYGWGGQGLYQAVAPRKKKKKKKLYLIVRIVKVLIA
jgi:hypothetical protein